ncbi:MAG: peptide-methionine (S)-S-oxide reductase MsrA [Anaerotignum sp.]|nr:peptide-methionine (S)-S-oxide reductase MsrA [Anaerotignum sp.]
MYLAGGCFWGTEHYMKTIDGVLETRTGYALGERPLWNPPLKETVTYEEVCSHSGHAETVEIVFDADKISLTEILKEYAYTIDPTSLGRQGMDIGIQYRTGIYSLNEEQKQTAAEFLTELQKDYKQPIMIENLPLRQFIPAEEYHQDYLEKNPGGYCHINFDKIARLKQQKS